MKKIKEIEFKYRGTSIIINNCDCDKVIEFLEKETDNLNKKINMQIHPNECIADIFVSMNEKLSNMQNLSKYDKNNFMYNLYYLIKFGYLDKDKKNGIFITYNNI